MDTNYNINKLDDTLKKLFKEVLVKKKGKKINELLNDLLEGNDSKLISKEYKKELSNYSKDTIRLLIEKNILLSIENKALALRKSYWEVLKTRAPRISIGILNHYFDTYISDLKKDKVPYYKTRTIDELNKVYDNEINKTFGVFENNIQTIMDNSTSMNLDHMENLNANGRVVSIDENKKGGIFLDKESKIGYGKFVNKDELLNAINNIKTLPNQSKVVIKDNKIDIDDLKIIIESMRQTIKVEQNEKITKQDARIISTNDKKAGSIFLGNKGIDLPNGEYVSVEEMTQAVNKFVNQRENNVITKPTKVVNIKSKFKQIAVAATLAISILSASLALKNNKEQGEPRIVVQTETDSEQINNSNNLLFSDEANNKGINFEIEKSEKNEFEIVQPSMSSIEDESLLNDNIEQIDKQEIIVNDVIEKQPDIEIVTEPITEKVNSDIEKITENKVEKNVQEITMVTEPINEMAENISSEREIEPMKEETISNNLVEESNKIEEISQVVEEQATIGSVAEPMKEQTISNNSVEESNETGETPQVVEEQSIPEIASELVEPPVIEVVPEQPVSNYIEGNIFQAKSYNTYSYDEIYQLAAIVGGEDNGTYEGALAVISTMCNRADTNNSDPLSQAKSGAYSSYGGEWYNKHINGGIPDHVLSATIAGLNGTRNTTAESFRGADNYAPGRVQIGEPGNCNNYFNFLGDQVIISNDNQLDPTGINGKAM